ncbi:pilus assembly protein [Mesorhizobium sp. B2-4-12]|uniref:TadE/TadG family type IV pilus assembly protein n=1 Tax=unclassified Mesorhizobium TaxID=325217 RepID=UPI00112C5A08|nr:MULTISPECIES: TadE/TadG family type IV pilus assembly protein [unclassified Mesorhizobium]TPK85395.1 pilus assembly protein [Mesorhizobium sp. B2-4-17]TPK89606.1 pilus assembly protein [Mesorhizobium sp. B2-4-12]
MLRTIRAFWNDQRGIAMILVAIMIPVLIGFAVLAIDVSRLNGLHNDLQKGADAMALAGAGELDGKTDAIVRADRALATLVLGNTYFSSDAAGGPQALLRAGVTRRYLRSIPASDETAIGAADVITDEVAGASSARFVEVTATPVGFSAIFPVSIVGGGSGSFNIGAVAVAGFNRAVCDFTPMFICNPYTNLANLASAIQGHKRSMMVLKQQGPGAQFGPGNYGFLQTPDGGTGTTEITQMVAAVSPKACYSQNGVRTGPGNRPPINDGFNTRFDIYPNGNGSGVDPVTDPPAPNTIKGMVTDVKGKNCGYVAPSGTQLSSYKALPQDTCLPNCTSPQPDRLGDGDWDRKGYWNVNHTPAITSWPPAGTGLDANASRYEVYQWELQNLANHGAEPVTPACNTSSTDPARRLVYVAILNCDTTNGGVSVQGNGGPYPVDAFASFFLTQPADSPPNANVYGEIVDISSQWGTGTLTKFQRDEAQLYR